MLLIPTWFLLVVWVGAAGMTVGGQVTNDIVGPALLGGLVLIVMLIGFTVMQHAFAGGVDARHRLRRRAPRAGADRRRRPDLGLGRLRRQGLHSPETESLLGLKRGTLEGPAAKWLEVLHPLDQDRFRAALDSVLDQRRGRLVQDFRLRTPDGHFMWFSLKARPVIGSDGEVVRVVGTLTDVTEFKNAEERLLHDAVHDNLTGLPNRQLFMDRLEAVAAFAQSTPNIRPTVMVIDLDRFKQVNESVGISVGDSILLTLARRLTRILKPQDTLARLAGDQFGLILLSEREPAKITAFAETIRKTIRAPIAFNDREIFLTASIGLALSDAQAPINEEISRTPSSRCITPSAWAATASRCSSRPCARASPTASPWKPTCAARSSATRSTCCTSRSCGSKTAPSRASRRWRAGIIPSSGGCRRRNSSRSPRRPG